MKYGKILNVAGLEIYQAKCCWKIFRGSVKSGKFIGVFPKWSRKTDNQ